MSEVSSDPTFTAYCSECGEVAVMENIAHVVKCHGCGFIVLGSEVTDSTEGSDDE